MSNTKNKEIKEMEVKEEVTVNVPEVDEETEKVLAEIENQLNAPAKRGFLDCVVDGVKGFGKATVTFAKRSLPVLGGVALGIGGAMLYSYLSYNKEENQTDTDEDIIDGEGQYVDEETEE